MRKQLIFLLLFIIFTFCFTGCTDNADEVTLPPAESSDFSMDSSSQIEGFSLKTLEKCINEEYMDSSFKNAELNDKGDILTIQVYFKRYSESELDIWRDEALIAGWKAFKAAYTYMDNLDNQDNMFAYQIQVYFPDDGEDMSGAYHFWSRITSSKFALINFEEDDFTQIGTCAYDYGWVDYSQLDIWDYQYRQFQPKTEASLEQQSSIENEANNLPTDDLETSNTVVFDREWYKTYSYMSNSATNTSLALIWFDDGTFQIAINGLSLYSFYDEDFSILDDGTIVYLYNDELILKYYPQDRNAVQLIGGEFQGYYYPEQ